MTADTCPDCGGTQKEPHRIVNDGGFGMPSVGIGMLIPCSHAFHGEHSCWTCMNDDICKGYRDDLPVFGCRDWEADDE